MTDLAEDQIKKSGEEVTDSRVSVMTGLHRRDVKRLRQDEKTYEGQQLSLLMRVIGRWRSDIDFVTKNKSPRILTYGTEESQFNELVSRVSKDLNPATVFFELERIKAIEKTSKGIKLKVHSYVPSDDAEEGFKLLAYDVGDLVSAVESNILGDEEVPNLHVRTEYDNVRPEKLDEIRRWFIREGHLLHQRARNYVSQYDEDINPSPDFKGKGQKVVLSSFSFIEEENEHDDE